MPTRTATTGTGTRAAVIRAKLMVIATSMADSRPQPHSVTASAEIVFSFLFRQFHLGVDPTARLAWAALPDSRRRLALAASFVCFVSTAIGVKLQSPHECEHGVINFVQ
jgi:hypothetical protein